VVYGIGSQRFAMMTGLSQTVAEDIMRRYFATYRGTGRVAQRRGAKVISTERAARRRRQNDRVFDLTKTTAKRFLWRRETVKICRFRDKARHFETRPASASRKNRRNFGRLVNIVHDEIIVEADASEAESAADKLEKAMCTAGEEYITKVPVKVDVKIADEWAK
jgi:DNA polymerase I-like protein with 3'-5' exonuclease and polymerase domains